jgi:hypothetical protein
MFVSQDKCFSRTADVQSIEGTNIQSPIHEWILTDSCGLTFVNTAAVYAPSMIVSSATSYTPSLSTLFGKSPTSNNFNVRANDVKIDFSRSFTIVYWFKSFVTVTELTIAKIQYIQLGTAYYLLVDYNGATARISSSLKSKQVFITSH